MADSDSRETFRNNEGRYMVPGLLGLLLLPPGLLSFLNFEIVAVAFFGGSLLSLTLVASVTGRTRLELSSSVIRYRIIRTRIVAWEDVVGDQPSGVSSKQTLRIEDVLHRILRAFLTEGMSLVYRQQVNSRHQTEVVGCAQS